MKTKVSQKEWNDKRDHFLCAMFTSVTPRDNEDYENNAIKMALRITSKLYEVEEKIEEQEQSQDTRPFNPKVVEIFNTYLPKEIAPLAIEAHKRSVEHHQNFNVNVKTLEGAIRHCLHWNVSFELGRFNNLHLYTNGNTITATPEQLREWFPLAYEGGENV